MLREQPVCEPDLAETATLRRKPQTRASASSRHNLAVRSSPISFASTLLAPSEHVGIRVPMTGPDTELDFDKGDSRNEALIALRREMQKFMED